MKKFALVFWTMIVIYSPCQARDFIVEFVEENYKETQLAYSNDPLIYHSIQVTSPAGPKLLVLTGNHPEYRRWLRQYIAGNKQLIAQVQETENDLFLSSSAYEIEVTKLHPMNGEKWRSDLPESVKTLPLEGENHILVIDANPKRSRMISTIIQRMGYSAMVFPDGSQGLETFNTHPEKFKMVIANHKIPDMKAETLVDQILKLNSQIPILVETGYQDQKTRDLFVSRFSKAGSVTIKPVVLDDLQNTIKTLVKEKA